MSLFRKCFLTSLFKQALNISFYLLLKVHKALPGSSFNSLLLNRYKGGNDYVGWHADDEKLYGPTPEIASLSLGCDRDFVLKKKPSKKPHGMVPSVTRGNKQCSKYDYSLS